MPEGEIAYGIGDVHGCFNAMLNLLDKIELDRAARPEAKATLVFLGDLIDRGPASRQVIEFLRDYDPPWADIVLLKGNHEEVMLTVMEGNLKAMRSWLGFGGKSCARSYGVDNLGQLEISPENIMMSLQKKIPKSHMDFIDSFEDSFRFGDYLMVHAGIMPKVPLEAQTSQDMRWIREKFISYKKPHEVMVVHGHTVVETAEQLSNRIPVDTGAHKGGPLTAVCLAGGKVSFLTSEPLGD